ncbi:LysR family transcriptional regulator for metE and metH [Aquimarina sp. EL_43]|uniref:LysR family transcriptional regulator n=1 Tax=Aquimarina TaxID=290174 RepID=UPI0004713C6B|nr:MULTISPECIES: LysR family transcriptional regulator [Aquimarina]MBG6129840.1 LysR family transcriptional regulator for metE and metH [Aquimarina sp. EL_35]MBG6150905.1 LysR family transcriptional regulator for metE and metH [Aquimarina sp. EL_32]MBG6167788.1 LysR family transcriptional regulator for metE and metH [Aquimarina sp. EL_43]
MDIKYFRLIKTITEEGNIANSSERLFLTQSALSHQLKELETRLGFKVFHRTRNKWKLTEEGIELYKIANNVLETIEQGFNTIQQIKTGSKGNIKVSTECYSFYQGLPGFIQKMGMLYPQIDVDLILEATHQPISKLLSNEIDIALVTSIPANDRLSSITLFEDETYAIMHKEHRYGKTKYLSASDFADIHLIIHSFPLETVSVYEQFLKPNNITPIKISAIPLTEVSLEMVNANMGIICMPKWALKSLKIPTDLIFKSIGKYGVKRTHYLVVRKEDMHKKYINDFVLSFKEEFLGI